MMCEICRQVIGVFDTDVVEHPIRGAMFESKDPKHGFPPPFTSPGLEWTDMRCPYCKRRPFFSKDYIWTTEGAWSPKLKSHGPLGVQKEFEPSRMQLIQLNKERFERFDMDTHRLDTDIVTAESRHPEEELPDARKEEAERRLALDNEEPFPCKLCEKGYQHESSLKRHVARDHSGGEDHGTGSNGDSTHEGELDQGGATT
jgi:hypothetical protein